MKQEKLIEMVGECTSKFSTQENDDGSIEILISVPKRFKDLWLVKLTELSTTIEEIEEYEK